MENILLLTDFSESSINAMRYALQLLKEDQCNFYVLHVQSSASYTTDDLMTLGNSSIYDSIVKKSKNRLMKLVERLKDELGNKNFNYQIIVDFDALIDSVKQVIISKNIDLIVMGTNGVTGAKEVVFGSNTINVIRKVDCPTLAIPEAYGYKKPNDVLLPLDLQDSLRGSAFMKIIKFTTDYAKTLHILRIISDSEGSVKQKEDLENINIFLKETDHKYHKIQNVPMHYAVSCYSQTHNINLITLLVQKESFFERFFTGSTTTQISNKMEAPLLIIHY
ncbi:universal stress protein [Hyunsoonleella rubra]|uniref:Universal stress protein n=1 Tax=Hyunsoonleella rubra TaxID=1737062 RepID=A0ABW5T5Z2_9FLAO